MIKNATVFEVMIASPGDASEERLAVAGAIQRFNLVHGISDHVLFQPLMWEYALPSHNSGTAQSTLNEMLVDRADMLIGIFLNRVGGGTVAASGTIQEIERAIARDIPVYILLSDAPDPQDLSDDELIAIRSVRRRFRSEGYCIKFGTAHEVGALASGVVDRFVTERRLSDGRYLSDNIELKAELVHLGMAVAVRLSNSASLPMHIRRVTALDAELSSGGYVLNDATEFDLSSEDSHTIAMLGSVEASVRYLEVNWSFDQIRYHTDRISVQQPSS